MASIGMSEHGLFDLGFSLIPGSPVPFIYGSLKLYSQLRVMTQSEDPNDDLVEVWKENEQAIALGLVNLLKHSRHFSDDSHQPLKIVNDVLARQIAKVPIHHLESSEELYSLLYVESQPVQQARQHWTYWRRSP